MLSVQRIPAGTVLRELYTVGDIVTEGQGAEGPTYHATGKGGHAYFVRDVGPTAVGDTMPEGANRYREAVHAVRAFSHPNLSRVVDNFASQGRELIVLEAPAGQSLDDVVMARVPPSRRRIHVLLHQLCIVLAYADSREPSFIFDTLKTGDIYVDSAGHITIHTYRLSRAFETGAVPLFSSEVKDRAHNFTLLADLAQFILQKSRRRTQVVDPRFKAVLKRLNDFADAAGYTFQEASRALATSLDTGMLLTGELTDPEEVRRTNAKLYATKTVFKGVDRDGRVRTGEIQSDTLQAAVENLRGLGVKVQDVHFEGWRDRLWATMRRLPAIPIAVLFGVLCVVGGLVSLRPRAVTAPMAQHGRVMVATDDGGLLAIEAGTLAVSRVGSLPGRASDVKVLADGTVLAVLNSRSRTVSMVRADNGQPVMGDHPWHGSVDKLLLSPDRAVLYCIDKDKGTVAVLSGADFALQTTMKVPGRVGDAVLAPDGRLMYVSLPRLNTIYGMDLRGARKASFGINGGPDVLAMPRAGELWIGCLDRVVRVVSLDARHASLATPIDFNGHLVAIVFPTPTRGIVLCDDGSVTALDGYQKGLTLASDGPGPMAFTLGLKGDLWVSSGKNKTLRVLDGESTSLDKKVALPARPLAMDAAP